jgi:hypothetical protein
MKKLMELIKNKERDEAPAMPQKTAKEDKKQTGSNAEKVVARPNDLFWDDYSDLGYC